MTNPTSPDGGYRFTPAEIQQQLIQCTDLLRKFETSYLQQAQEIDNKATFLRNWYRALIAARTRYLEQEHLTEAQWNALAWEGLTE